MAEDGKAVLTRGSMTKTFRTQEVLYGVNSPESTYQIILKPDAFPMDRGWYRLHRGATGHGSDATACTPGRVVRL